ncbi:MAG TPA: histidine phosphatase family protein [Microbacteriaceae bacterium]|nr:histidine phosphatase family protein [Microbacteriaceae bacterium]HQX35412.1 histidine phosphatase family protein [Microbacteriaceae bacterium]HQZ48008.1 histidine phosphatase family protein [Microbacteriaceae bacterium]HRA08165.1 histidine phosphatase family protein [Microbacteriaceae bacterium]
MPANRVHLVRHGEVFNPDRVLYGRLPNFRLSDSGRRMALAAAEYVRALERPVTELVSSPLQRAQESSEPFAELFALTPRIDERVIEPTNVFEGKQMKRALRNPLNWWHLRRPSVPSWGEPNAQIAARMADAMDAAWRGVDDGDVVIVSHQAPIWITHLHVAGERLTHDPRSRRCALSSVTSFERTADGVGWTEVAYAEPAATDSAVDVGAV